MDDLPPSESEWDLWVFMGLRKMMQIVVASALQMGRVFDSLIDRFIIPLCRTRLMVLIKFLMWLLKVTLCQRGIILVLIHSHDFYSI